MAAFTFRLARTDPAAKANEFRVELEDRMTVLDALFLIQREQDPTLSFRCSCRVGMCGTCAMTVNWQPRLACQTRVVTLKSDTIVVEPLDTLPVVKDLVVSMEPFFAKWKKVRPALHPKDKNSKTLAIVPPKSEFGKQAGNKRDCITCGACYSACGITDTNEGYLGPAAINRAMLRLMDPRDEMTDERLKVLNDENGVWRCHTQFNCVAACPKNINLTDSIMKMKRSLLFPKRFNDKRNFINNP
ncbi:MAG TPA: succinate dehydrogenase/fumarate reductase iron-sulfur subunit [Tepidisphaeraceae bacterium]|jgi:succinate dehydrogenase/fumarate reductase iron-sulfur protein